MFLFVATVMFLLSSYGFKLTLDSLKEISRTKKRFGILEIDLEIFQSQETTRPSCKSDQSLWDLKRALINSIMETKVIWCSSMMSFVFSLFCLWLHLS